MAAPRSKNLLNVAYEGDLERLKKIVSILAKISGDDLAAIFRNTRDGDGRCALHYAASGGKSDVLKYLIEEIKLIDDINVKDYSGETPMACAAMNGREDALSYLWRMGANPEIPNDLNMIPLHHAAMNGHNGCIIMLESFGISNIDVSNDFGSPLKYACGFGHDDTAKLLLHQYKANPNLIFNEVTTSLHISISSGSWKCVELLLKAGADPNGGPDGIKALTFAAERGETQIIKLLVEAGADPNVKSIHGLMPVEEAALLSNRQGVEILFPVTSPIPSYVDWSIDGVMKHVKSRMFNEKMMIHKKYHIFPESKSRGTSAFRRKEYWLAAFWYSQALQYDPNDAAVLSNLSLCYVHLNRGDYALKNAIQCVLSKPDWPKAHYRKGVALKLLNRFGEAAEAFLDGLKLDPENKELEAAFREVSMGRM